MKNAAGIFHNDYFPPASTRVRRWRFLGLHLWGHGGVPWVKNYGNVRFPGVSHSQAHPHLASSKWPKVLEEFLPVYDSSSFCSTYSDLGCVSPVAWASCLTLQILGWWFALSGHFFSRPKKISVFQAFSFVRLGVMASKLFTYQS